MIISNKMKKKVLAFIVYEDKFLALERNKHPDHAPKGGWFVVTGGVKENESYKQAVTREVKEETKLHVKDIFPLNWGSVYELNYKGQEIICEEHNFLVSVNSKNVVLNEEHASHVWLNLDQFIKKIDWSDNKELLKKVLSKALKKKSFFDKLTIKDYRE